MRSQQGHNTCEASNDRGGKGLRLNSLQRDTSMDVMKSRKLMGTKLKKIALLSHQNQQQEFGILMPHFTKENLMSCYHELDGRKAVGIDGQTKEEYGRNLEHNIERLIADMKELKYRPKPVRQVLIPKGNGKKRPLGISNIEDKIVQMMFAKILEAIYDPIFHDFSYGFRRGKSAHSAITDTIQYLRFNNVKTVIDIDLENYFGNIQHGMLMQMLEHKIKDKIFLRYISRMLKAGIVTSEGLIKDNFGVPQGAICSPVLANIYAHYAIDDWFKTVVPKHIIGEVGTFRYCDDIVICCTDTRDVDRVICSLNKRLEKFGLDLNREKTKKVHFNRYTYSKGLPQGTFDFLGFTFYIDMARKGFVTVKVKTSKKTLKEKLANVKTWIVANRFKGKMKKLWTRFCEKLKGHIVYFGVTNNSIQIKRFLYRARRIFFKWINRRSQRNSTNWVKFQQFENEFPMPKVRIYHRLY